MKKSTPSMDFDSYSERLAGQFGQLNDKRFYFSNGHTRRKIQLSKGGKQGTREDTEIKCFKTNF